MWPNPQKSADLVTFTKENLHKKLHLLCSEGVLFTPLEAEVILVHIFPHSDWIRRDTRTEYREIPRISPYSVRMWENADQNNSEYRHFLRSNNSRFFLESIIATLVFYFFKSSQKPLKNLAKCLKWSFRLADWLDFYCYQKQYFCSCRIVLYSFFILGKKQ